MLSEFAFSPSVFCCENEAELKHILLQLKSIGLLADLNGANWSKQIREILETENFVNKKFFQNFLEVVNKNNRLIIHKKNPSRTFASNIDWVYEAIDEHNSNELCLIGASQEDISMLSLCLDNIKKLSDFAINEKWENALMQSKLIGCTKNEYEKHLSPFLKYANYLTIIDPHLGSLQSNQMKFLNICFDLLGKEKQDSTNKEVYIHVRDKGQNKTAFHSYIASKYPIKVNVYFWNDVYISMHDRYLLTEQSGISIPRGCELLKDQDTLISMVQDVDKAQLWHKYNSNNHYSEYIKNYK